MTFPYLDLSRGGVIRAKPIIPIRFHGPQGFRQIVALVDSGAEHSVVSIELIESLGLPTKNAQAVEVIGVGGHAGRGYLLDVEHQLGNHHWNAPAIFSDVMDSQSPMIMAQAGFFEFFTVTFKRRKLLMDIRRAR
ncbi:MAG TPA: retropepsin-like aspartic protease [Pirellulales bacterium]